MEGMASGLPVVSTSVDMAEDLIQTDVTGGLVRGEKANEIAGKAMHLLYCGDMAGLCERACEMALVTDCNNIVCRERWSKVYQPAM
jgi:glycosyltransferase involved in cell wall biosynthesis